ncbi:hypothetical protein MNBD_GAMMA10-1649 [hydrothermal vent metagenome]|uniref:Uncharacterized protein n=1 Tax=hydrothermal vent metagenome TaxID=652676 RepID=A0A3B0XUD1_9ZZZZ
MKKTINYNPEGKWSVKNVQKRYNDLAKRYKIKNQVTPMPCTHTNKDGFTWVYNIMDSIAKNLEINDKAYTQLAIEYIADNVMGSTTGYIRETLARKLRRVDLSENQKLMLINIFLVQLKSGKILKEYKEYIRLFKLIGVKPYTVEIEACLNSKKNYIKRAAIRLMV